MGEGGYLLLRPLKPALHW